MDIPSLKPQFIQVLLPEFMQKLWIPRKFGHHIGLLVNRKATLHSPLGKLWYIKVEQEDGAGGRLYFGEGWKEFVDAHKLRRGYTMVFCYEGGTNFTFKVFDLTTCLKVYTPTIADMKKNAEKKAPMMTDRKLESRSFSMEKPHHLERIIRPSHVTYKYLDIPIGFCEVNGLKPGKEVVLRNPEGKTWRVRIRRGGVGSFKIGMGWLMFFWGNKLKVGDKCVFDAVTVAGKSVVLVQICRG